MKKWMIVVAALATAAYLGGCGGTMKTEDRKSAPEGSGLSQSARESTPQQLAGARAAMGAAKATLAASKTDAGSEFQNAFVKSAIPPKEFQGLRALSDGSEEFVQAVAEPFSTFSLKTAIDSWGATITSIRAGMLPDPATVRIEELMNYFSYENPDTTGAPLTLEVETFAAPWREGRGAIYIGLHAREGAESFVAYDAKLRVEFNPAKTKLYSLVGYDELTLPDSTFESEASGTGVNLRPGESVVALYQVEPEDPSASDVAAVLAETDYLSAEATTSDAWATVRVKYRETEGGAWRTLEATAPSSTSAVDSASANARFATAVAGFGLLLKGAPWEILWGYHRAAGLASTDDRYYEEREEFLEAASRARACRKYVE